MHRKGAGLRLLCQTPSDRQVDGGSGCRQALSIQSKEGQDCSPLPCPTRDVGAEQTDKSSGQVCCHECLKEAQLSYCVGIQVTEKVVLSHQPHLVFLPRLRGRKDSAETAAPCPLILHRTCPSAQKTSSLSLNVSPPPRGHPDYSS